MVLKYVTHFSLNSIKPVQLSKKSITRLGQPFHSELHSIHAFTNVQNALEKLRGEKQI